MLRPFVSGSCRAGQCAAAGNCQGADRQAADAAKTLDDARKQLAQRRRQARAELALEQLARMEDALKHLRRRQQQALEKTQRFDRLQVDQGRLTRAQTVGLRDLARLQRTLREETQGLGEKLLGAGVFQLALAGAAQSMGRAAGMLDLRQTSRPTQEAQRYAAGRLDLVLEALEKEPPDDDPNADAGGGAGAGAGAGQAAEPGEAIQSLAELKLLKLLQKEINLRTEQLQQAIKERWQAPPERQVPSRFGAAGVA